MLAQISLQQRSCFGARGWCFPSSNRDYPPNSGYSGQPAVKVSRVKHPNPIMQEDDPGARLRGFGLAPPEGPWDSFVGACLDTWKVIRRALDDFINAFLYSYRKRRRRIRSLVATVPLSDSMSDDIERTGVDILQDEPEIVLYKTQSGKLLTPEMISRGEGITAEPIKVAVECSNARAEELVQYLEQIMLDRDLDENEKMVIGVLKKKLAQRWVE